MLVMLVGLFAVNAGEDPKSKASFERLKSLQGTWQRAGDEQGDFKINFSSTANGSVLLENWVYQGASHSMTVYHMDGEQLLATHYCPQGNQPRLQLDSVASDGELVFGFKDVTNLTDANASHQHSLGFAFTSDNTLTRSEQYLVAGELKPSELKLVKLAD